jgi:hypothetical protein
MTKPALQPETEYRSRFERKIAEQLQEAGIEFEYETVKVSYIVPARKTTYRPDFPVAAGAILLETKGWFKPKDRQKLALVKEQNPDLDIRLVFQGNAERQKIHKDSQTTYAKWCDTHGFPWCQKGDIPASWIKEIKQTRKPK